MKITVLFFANFREMLECENIDLEIAHESSVSDLCQLLADKGSIWQSIFSEPSKQVKVAVNQEMVSLIYSLSAGDEVAFFPPVTGG